MKLLTESEFQATFGHPMQRISMEADPPVAFWSYYDTIPAKDFAGHDCSRHSVSNAWNDATGRFQHVLVNTENKNVFMVIVLDLHNASISGHRLLDLNCEYGLPSAQPDAATNGSPDVANR